MTHLTMCCTSYLVFFIPQSLLDTADIRNLVNPLKCSGVRQLHLKVLSAIQI